MNKTLTPAALALLLLLTACSGDPVATHTSIPSSAANESSSATSTPASAVAPISMSEYILSLIPQCDGVQVLEPITFDWPNLQQRIEELEGSDWGYYACPHPYEEMAEFYRTNATEPPYLLSETNWVVIPEGTLGVYFHSVRQTWIYLWIVPQSPGSHETYVIAAYSLDLAFVGGECRQIDSAKPREA